MEFKFLKVLLIVSMVEISRNRAFILNLEHYKERNGTMTLGKGKFKTNPIGKGAVDADHNCTYKHTILGHVYGEEVSEDNCCGLCEYGGNGTVGTFSLAIGPIINGDKSQVIESDWPVAAEYAKRQCDSFEIKETRNCNGQTCTLTYENPKGFTKMFLYEFTTDNNICAPDQYNKCILHDKRGDCTEIMWECEQGFSFIRDEAPPTYKPSFNEYCPGIKTGEVVREKRAAVWMEGANVVLVSRETEVMPVLAVQKTDENIIVDAILMLIEVAFLIAGAGGLGVSVWDAIQIAQIEKDLVKLEQEINVDLVEIQSAINTDRQSMRDLQCVSIVNTVAIHTLFLQGRLDDLNLNSSATCELLSKDGIKVTKNLDGSCTFEYPYGQLLEIISNIDTSNITINNVTVDNFTNDPFQKFWNDYGNYIILGGVILALITVGIPIIQCVINSFKRR